MKAVLRDGVAETEIDQTFSNPGSQPIEGWYWFTVPPTAMVTGFALETNGQLVEGEVIEKREAAAQYGNAMRQGNDPALLEWEHGNTFKLRVFPIEPKKDKRVVLRYTAPLRYSPTAAGCCEAMARRLVASSAGSIWTSCCGVRSPLTAPRSSKACRCDG